MPGDAPTPAAGSSIWNSNGLLDPASLWHSSLMAPPTLNGDPLNSRLFVVCGKSIEVRWRLLPDPKALLRVDDAFNDRLRAIVKLQSGL